MSQQWRANQYIDHASFVADHGLTVLKLLNPRQGERILDLGCGDGALTQDIKKTGAIVHGVDSSQSMIEAALARGLSAEVMSGDKLTFMEEFNAVFFKCSTALDDKCRYSIKWGVQCFEI